MRRFLCLLIACCFAAACSANLSTTPEATAPPQPTAPNFVAPTDTPFVMPTPPPPPTPACPDAPPTRLILNQRGRVLPDDPRPINLRAEPGTDGRMMTTIPIMEVFFVLEGPVCNGDYAWFRIQYGDDQGWIAEGDLSSYYVEPYLPE